MSTPKSISFVIELLKQLPSRPAERIQGGPFRLPMWVDTDDDEDDADDEDEYEQPFRPWATIWLNVRGHTASEPAMDRREPPDHAEVLKSLVRFACDQKKCGFRPGTVEVRDPALAAYLQEQVADAGIQVKCCDRRPEFEAFVAQMAREFHKAPLPPDALSVKGVTMEMMRAFAEAAAEYFNADLHLHLTDEDLVRVEAPAIDDQMRLFTVLGHYQSELGLAFFDSVATFDRVSREQDPHFLMSRSPWMLTFDVIEVLPFGDSDLWLDHGFPVADEDAYPLAIRPLAKGGIQRPNPKQLAVLEGLLRALARTTEEELDAGRWTKTVSTSAGQKTFTLDLSDLLSDHTTKPAGAPGLAPLSFEKFQLDIQKMLAGQSFENIEQINSFLNTNVMGKVVPPRQATTPLEQAQDLCYEAQNARGRRRLMLAKKAQALSPDCSDAYLLQAEWCESTRDRLPLLEQAVAAGERQHGADFFTQNAGHFWGITETRPYMRARMELAMALNSLGRPDEAAEHYREMLRLNPNDNQGVREPLLAILLRRKHTKEAEALLKSFKEPDMAIWAYARALLTFMQKGPTPTAKKQAKAALEVNPTVAKIWFSDIAPPPLPDCYSPGSTEEAAHCAFTLGLAWHDTPGAMDWLRQLR